MNRLSRERLTWILRPPVSHGPMTVRLSSPSPSFTPSYCSCNSVSIHSIPGPNHRCRWRWRV